MSLTEQLNNKRIAKNTLLLYMRMFFVMIVQLYTSRVVLSVLGVVDYGVYNVVGGIVAMFVCLNSAMTTSTQRYITFELGRNNQERLKAVFVTSIYIHMVVALVIVICAETLGLWFLKEKMIIPENRASAAMWVFQLSIFTTVVAVMSYPYNAVIIAHEKMSAFAYISVIETILKLAIVYLLSIGNFDKLILYAVLIAVVQVFVRFVYSWYCSRHFEETRFCLIKDVPLFKEMLSFAGWNLWGNLAAVLYSQGINMLLNVFFGPVVNAARAVSVQVQSAIQQVASNFQMAINPQITKSYANGELDRMHELVFRSSRYTFLLLFIICWPVIIESSFVLKMWLGSPPPYSTVFLKIILITMLIDSTSGSLTIAASATGCVKKYQATIGGILMLIVPVAYLVLRLGGAPHSVFVVHLAICCFAYVIRLFFVSKMVRLKKLEFFKSVGGRCFLVSLTTCLLTMAFFWLQKTTDHSVLNIIACVAFALISVLLWGLDSHERKFLISKIKRRTTI